MNSERMDAATQGGLFTGGCGVVIIAVAFLSNDSLLTLFNGTSPTGTPISPLLAAGFGALLVLYGILSVAGLMPEKYEWQPEDESA